MKVQTQQEEILTMLEDIMWACEKIDGDWDETINRVYINTHQAWHNLASKLKQESSKA